MWQTVNVLLTDKKTTVHRAFTAAEYHDFANRKISDIRDSMASASDPVFYNFENTHLCTFVSISLDDVLAAIQIAPSKECSSDPLPTWLLKDCVILLDPYIQFIINTSWKHAIVSPLLRKPWYRRVSSVKLQTCIQPAIFI